MVSPGTVDCHAGHLRLRGPRSPDSKVAEPDLLGCAVGPFKTQSDFRRPLNNKRGEAPLDMLVERERPTCTQPR